jgi:hypothetical protein
MVTPLTTKLPPEMVSPVMVFIVAVYPEPLSKSISKVLLSYVKPVTEDPPVSNNLQFDSGPPVTPSIVDPVHAFINA